MAGVVLAFMWLGEVNEPPWAHGLHTVVLLLIVPSLLLPANRRLTAALHAAARPGRALARLIAAAAAPGARVPGPPLADQRNSSTRRADAAPPDNPDEVSASTADADASSARRPGAADPSAR
ncbi:hypothetical protein [Streptomyces mirabilis]|uniref:hypothetical protein n=1 Tax=Streptomyces mirabilis TaxID=68239 RepID=UPI0036E22621